MGWLVRYGLRQDTLDATAVTQAARNTAKELGAELRVQESEDDVLQTWFTIPMAALVALEDEVFGHEMTASRLGGAVALTLVATFMEGPRGCVFTIESDDAANDLCYETARWIARRLGQRLDGWPL